MKKIASATLVALVLLLAEQRMEAQTAKFRFLAAIYADDKAAGLSLPEGVACGTSGEIVVADTGNDRLLRFTFRDKTFGGGSPIQLSQIAAPSRVYLNSKREIYALSNKDHRVVHLSAAGEFKETLSFEGAPPPAAVLAKDFAIDAADNIYVLDVFSARLLVANAQGKFLRALPLPADIGFASDLAVDDTGTVLLLDSVKRRLFSAGKDATAFAPVGGDLTEAISTMPTFMTANKGTTFIVEGNGSRIVSVRRDGTFMARQLTAGREEGSLDQPAQMCINDKDEVFVADRGNSRIQVFQLIR